MKIKGIDKNITKKDILWAIDGINNEIIKVENIKRVSHFKDFFIANIVGKDESIYLMECDIFNNEEQAKFVLNNKNNISKIEFLKDNFNLEELDELLKLGKNYKYLARDKSYILYAYKNKPKKKENLYYWKSKNKYYSPSERSNLFKTISWSDKKPLNIKSTLKEIYYPYRKSYPFVINKLQNKLKMNQIEYYKKLLDSRKNNYFKNLETYKDKSKIQRKINEFNRFYKYITKEK